MSDLQSVKDDEILDGFKNLEAFISHGLAMLQAALTGLTSDVGALRAEMHGLEHRMLRRFDAVDARLDRVEARLDGVEARLDGVEARLDRVEARLDRVEARLDKLEARPRRR